MPGAASPYNPVNEREIKVYINANAYVAVDPERDIFDQQDEIVEQVKAMLKDETINNFHDVEIEEVE